MRASWQVPGLWMCDAAWVPEVYLSAHPSAHLSKNLSICILFIRKHLHTDTHTHTHAILKILQVGLGSLTGQQTGRWRPGTCTLEAWYR